MHIRCIVADAPKRAELRCVKNHQAYYGCDLCKMKAVPFKNKKERSKPAWTGTKVDNLRTHEWTLQMVQQLESLKKSKKKVEEKDLERLCGIRGRSVLFDFGYLDVVYDVPPEYMHFVCLGIVKILSTLTFAFSGNRYRRFSSGNAKRIPVSRINSELLKIRVPSEFSRKIRGLDPADWKAEEYRNLILFYFPVLFTVASSSRDAESLKIWLTLAFLIRAYVLPEKEFKFVSKSLLQQCQRRFIQKIRKVHGEYNCLYNFHMILHLDLIRQHGPLSKTSSFPYESMFSKIRDSFVPGTPNPVKQIFQTMYHRQRLGHICKKAVSMAPHETSMTDDSLAYIFNPKGHYEFFKINGVCKETRLLECKEIYVLERENELPFEKIGVFIIQCISSETVLKQKADLSGKVIRVGKYVLSIPNGVLREN